MSTIQHTLTIAEHEVIHYLLRQLTTAGGFVINTEERIAAVHSALEKFNKAPEVRDGKLPWQRISDEDYSLVFDLMDDDIRDSHKDLVHEAVQQMNEYELAEMLLMGQDDEVDDPIEELVEDKRKQLFEPESYDYLSKAGEIIARAEKDLGALTEGQRRDLLKSLLKGNTNWTSKLIEELVPQVPGAHVHEGVEQPGEPPVDVCVSCGLERY